MVRRRKQAKASGTKGDRPTLTLKIRPDTRSPLVSLPAEIQCIITSHVSTLVTPLAILQKQGDYHANRFALACSTSRPQSPFLYLQDLECSCSPHTIQYHRVEGSAAMESAPFSRKSSGIFIRRP